MTGINATNLLALRSQILQQNSVLQRAAATGPAATQAASPVTTTTAPAGGVSAPGGAAASGKADFSTALKGALDQVNSLQSNAEQASDAYEKGESTDIASVMLAREKASVGFQATLQVRNKLLSAYKDIMSMSV
jgi:flagellar hook-basal body complex protein FliE